MNCKHCGRPSIDEVDECTDWFSCQTRQIAHLKAENQKLKVLLERADVIIRKDIDRMKYRYGTTTEDYTFLPSALVRDIRAALEGR